MFLLAALHPRRAFDGAAGDPNLPRGTIAVAATGAATLVLELIAALVGNAGDAAVALSLAAPVLLAGFWLGGALLIGAGARLMGLAPRRRELLAVTGLAFPVLVLYAVITLIQAVSPRWGGDALSTAVGLLALPTVGWFVALNAFAVRALYGVSGLSAVAIALLPFAALSGVLLLLVVLLSLLHAAGLA